MNIAMKEGIALYNIYPAIKDKALPIRSAYKLSKIYNKISNDLTFYREQLDKLIDRYGEKDEDGNPIIKDNGIKVRLGCEDTFKAEITELDNLSVEVEDCSISLDELEGLELSIEQMTSLLPFIKE